MIIEEIIIETASLKETEIFYCDKLGLQIVDRSQDAITLQAGISRIAFRETNDQRPVYHFAFNIPENQLMDALSWIADRTKIIPGIDGAEIVDFENWNAKSFYFSDNNGNILEFLARYDLRIQKNGPFGPESLLGLSEIAIVTDNVTALAEQFITESSIPLFTKQPPHDNFTVLGNDEGLLILSLAGRNWFPTEIPSEKYPLTLRFKSEGNTFTYTFNTGPKLSNGTQFDENGS